METLIVETENTQRGCTIDEILSKHVICRSDADKKRYLPCFRQPTCTKNAELLKIAKECEKLFT